MSWSAIATGIEAALVADNGAGGFSNASPIVTGFFAIEAPQNQAAPYMVYSPVSETESKSYATGDWIEFEADFDIFTTRSLGTSNADTIAQRLRTVIDRVTVTAGTGWTAQKAYRLSGVGPMVEEELIHQIETYRFHLRKS